MFAEANQTVELGRPAERSDRGARVFVWGTWGLLVFVCLVSLVRDTRNIPLAEDWLHVAPLTGHETDFAAWLWAQNNEHRTPVARALLLASFWISGGDFRAGMLLNIASLAALAAAMIRVAQSLRGGRVSYADAFFPLVLLHLGHWENLLWSWQFTQVMPSVLALIILLRLAGGSYPTTPFTAIIDSLSLILLPLSGANGLLYVPGMASWMGLRSVLDYRRAKSQYKQTWPPLLALGSSLVSLAIMGWYFVGYESFSAEEVHPGIRAAGQAALQFMSLSFGPVAIDWWLGFVCAAVLVLAAALIVLFRAIWQRRGDDRMRALGLLLYLGIVVAFALALGWGRAAALAREGFWPLRYPLMSFPLLCTAYFAWMLYAPVGWRASLPYFCLVIAFVTLPMNAVHGWKWNSWFQKQATQLEADIAAGLSSQEIAARNNRFLVHWWTPERLAEHIDMLRQAKIGCFARIQTKQPAASVTTAAIAAPTQQPAESAWKLEFNSNAARILTIRFHAPASGEVFLVWGANGWQTTPPESWPAGTKLVDKVLHTPMSRHGEQFETTVKLPLNATLNFGFLSTKDRTGAVITPCWEEHPAVVVTENVTSIECHQTDPRFIHWRYVMDNVRLFRRKFALLAGALLCVLVCSLVVDWVSNRRAGENL